MLNILLDQADVAKALVTANKDEVLEGYVTEMLRIDPAIHGIYREAKANEVVDSASVKAGDLLYLDIAAANKNVSPSFFLFYLANDSHGTSGACLCEAHSDRSLPPQGALHPR